jgi:hypothetical protein
MSRLNYNRIGAIVPVACSLLALCEVAIVLATGWERHLQDEGAAAHIFQLLIVVQIPFVILYLATLPKSNMRRSIIVLGMQFLAAAAAIGAVGALGL